jgi:lipoic acid synthetase
MRKPDWLKMRLPGGEGYRAVRKALTAGGLHTVCESARCPNRGECWAEGTATFLILGSVCTRGCGFCSVDRGAPGGVVDEGEPARVAEAVAAMGLRYAVVTSVTRDDLPDGGASVFAATVRAIRALDPPVLAEVLVPDYLDGDLATVLDSNPEVVAHNVEVVERLTPALRHGRFSYRRSLRTLEQARATRADGLVKSSILLGLGETEEEIEATMRDLRSVGVDVLVLGQYLRPTPGHAEVVEYVHPDRFDAWAERGREMGFGFVASGPLVRTSYRAAEAFALHRAGRS